jgi:signal transduction histidine kinase
MDSGFESMRDRGARGEETAGRPFEGKPASNVCYFDRARVVRSNTGGITQRRRPLRPVRLHAAEFATANRRQNDFLAVIFHELRSPLAAICNVVYLLGTQNAGAAAEQRARLLIERQVGRMTRLVDDLLDVSRVGNSQLRLQRGRLDLRRVVQHAIETVASSIGERHLRLATSLPDAPVWLHADAGRLVQVFVNLLVNAVKYTDAGGELRLSVQEEDDHAVVRVRDSGIGIAPDMLPRVFNLFMQVDRSARHSEATLGIGLALARSVVELHGGSLTAASAGLGQGSEFTVRLPTA